MVLPCLFRTLPLFPPPGRTLPPHSPRCQTATAKTGAVRVCQGGLHCLICGQSSPRNRLGPPKMFLTKAHQKNGRRRGVRSLLLPLNAGPQTLSHSTGTGACFSFIL
jgi:hypothetical protein